MRSRVSADHVATIAHAVLEQLASLTLQAVVEYTPAVSAGVAMSEGDVGAEQLIGNAHAAAELAAITAQLHVLLADAAGADAAPAADRVVAARRRP